MCGLVAVINKNTNGFTQDQLDAFSTLLFVDTLRGDDSTGSFLVTNDGDLSLMKEASHALDFMQSKTYSSYLNRAFNRGSALVGHNRKATRGNITDENAHPFVVDNNIVLVHNGTLWGDHKKHADVEVDSHAIAHVIHETGNVQQAIEKIDGAYALIWYNVNEGVLNLLRNSQRPLWWMETSNAWYYCSEKSMLEFAASRHKLHLKQTPVEMPENVHQMFKLRNHGGWELYDEKIKIKSHQSYTPAGPWTRDGDCYMGGNYCPPAARPSFTPTPTSAPASAPSHGPYHGMTLIQRERIMAKSQNKILTNKEYQDLVLSQYRNGDKVVVEPFDYIETESGFYLYASPMNDPDVILRYYFSKTQADEQRILNMASGDYVFEMRVNTFQWYPIIENGLKYEADDKGYVIIGASTAELIYGGGIGSKDDARIRQLH